MENLEIEVQDKNQLALFTLLTKEQELEKNRIISRSKEIVNKELEKMKTKRHFLIANGFRYDINFVSDFQEVKILRGYNIGTYGDPLNVDLEVSEIKGDVYLIFNKYNIFDNKINLQKSAFSLEYGKMNCYGLQNYSSRMLKLETVLTKIEEANIRAEHEFEYANKIKSVLDYTVEKYTKLFPKAIVTKSTDSNRYGNKYESFDIVNIKFENGSYISLRLGFEIDKEFIHKKVDVVANKVSILGILNIFDLQNMK